LNPYDTADHVAKLRAVNITPHVTQNRAMTKTGKMRRSAIDARTTHHLGYALLRREVSWCRWWAPQRRTDFKCANQLEPNFRRDEAHS
jgi:hypothetical protein